MKRNLKQLGLALCGLMAVTAAADDGEMYSVSLNGKPQVLIILDTSVHMKKENTFPYPEYYDPNIAYPPIPDTKAENFIYKSFLGGEQFYYNKSDAAKAINHDEIRRIAKKAVDSFTGGPALTSSEQNLYDEFVATIPALNSDKRFSYSLMNCYSALQDFQGDSGAYQDKLSQLVATDIKLGDGVVGIPYHWKNIGDRPGIEGGILKRFVDCQNDIAAREKRNPGYEQSAFIKNSDSDDGSRDGYQEKESRQGLPADGAQKHWNAYEDHYQRDFDDINKAYIYADNLVKWKRLKDKQDAQGNIELSNLQIAKKVILDLMLDIKGVNAGLEIFNPNNAFTELNLLDNNGGRIISGIRSYERKDYSSDTQYQAARSLLKKQVGSIFTTGLSRSALCESLYEGYRYLYGKGVWFGDDFNRGIPKRDTSVESNSVYKSPLDWTSTCQNEAYIIMVTPGYHDVSQNVFDFKECKGIAHDYDHDKDANKKIRELPNVTEALIAEKSVQVNGDKDCDKNLLPVLSHWLANNDINPNTTDVKERIVTYTVGIGELPAGNKALLEAAAKEGEGTFYNALNANELRQKLEMAFVDIISRQNGTAATVATSINNDNVRANNNTVYYSMFQPNQTSKWQGNLRKLTVTNEGTLSAWTQAASSASRTDVKPALVTDSKAYFNDELYSGWSNEKGLNDVKVGGVVEAFKNRNTSRNIYITNADNSALVTLTEKNLKDALGVSGGSEADSDANLADALGVSKDTLDDAIAWLQGKDESGNFRADIFGDPMHAKPLVVNFSEPSGDETVNVPRIFIGTNSGFFHAFKDNGNTVEEEWAFIPKENLKRALKLNLQITKAENRIYGFDATAVHASYIVDKATNHVITFGERRGGSNYYSLNVALDPETQGLTKPSYNWMLTGDSNKSGATYLSQLGQTWSVPVVGRVFRGEGDASNDKPVLFFGGGYDDKKDECGSNGGASCADSLGKAIYVVDADTGSIMATFDSLKIKDSIASQLAIMDSNGDGYIDRIYAPDTGGNIYRIDMPILYNPTTEQYEKDINKWKLFTLAALGGDAKDDRRFFNPPSLVRARDNDINRSAYDGLLIGSGDIANPNSNLITQNYFFNIKDRNIAPKVWAEKPDELLGEVKYPNTLALENLQKLAYNSDHSTLTEIAVDEEVIQSGWAFTLNKLDMNIDGTVTEKGGEKSLGNAVVINGVVHFNTYSPFSVQPKIEKGQCVVNTSGSSHYYQLALNSGKLKNYSALENIIAKDIAVHVTQNSGVPTLRLLGAGKGELGTGADKSVIRKGSVEANVTLSPRAIYRYMNEPEDKKEIASE